MPVLMVMPRSTARVVVVVVREAQARQAARLLQAVMAETEQPTAFLAPRSLTPRVAGVVALELSKRAQILVMEATAADRVQTQRPGRVEQMASSSFAIHSTFREGTTSNALMASFTAGLFHIWRR
jgi:hypothetical protein